MSESDYEPLVHDHAAFLERARQQPGFQEAYEALALEYALAAEMLHARMQAGLTQEAVAQHMGTSKSAVSRLDSRISKVGDRSPFSIFDRVERAKPARSASACWFQPRASRQRLMRWASS